MTIALPSFSKSTLAIALVTVACGSETPKSPADTGPGAAGMSNSGAAGVSTPETAGVASTSAGAAGTTNTSGGTGGVPNAPAGGSTGGSKVGGAGGMPPNPCLLDGGCPPGEWIAVTPPTVSLTEGACGNYGTKTIQADPHHPADMYTFFFCQGLYKSTNYGQTWTGPINAGDNAAKVTDCAGGITLGPTNADSAPYVYLSCIRGSGTGFWRSLDGGTTWKSIVVANTPNDLIGQQFYPPIVNPYDNKHLLMAGHSNDYLLESLDAGDTWKTITPAPGMLSKGGTGAPAFIDMGDAATTSKTWLWLAAATGGTIGTWRTTNGGDTWTQVETNEHINGGSQIYQPDTKGSLFMAGVYSKLGWGVIHSPDYGLTWKHVGGGAQEAIVFGTSKQVYAMYGWGVGAGGDSAPSLQVAIQPGTGEWTTPGTPPEMHQGPAQGAVTSDGKNNIIVVANYNAGLWRFVEP